LRICSIGSGSKGNGTLIQSEQGTLLVDCGFGLKDTLKRIASKGVLPEELCGILVTHEHSDHGKGVGMLARKLQLPVYLSSGTYQALRSRDILLEGDTVVILRPESEVLLSGMYIMSVPVPHDARETFQYIFRNDAVSFGVLTDVGSITPYLIDAYSACKFLFLEFNHDVDMLWGGEYPESLKYRVSGNQGHLSNDQAIEFLQKINPLNIETLVVSHVSEKNNDLAKVDFLINQVIDSESVALVYADQATGTPWIDTTQRLS